jgi:hypothetical protein
LAESFPENITIIETVYADGREPLPPFIITPGAKLIENWISSNLIGNEKIDFSPTGYMNNHLVMQYANHPTKHTHAGPQKPWKVLLLDGHESHHFNPFTFRRTLYTTSRCWHLSPLEALS